MEEVKKFDKYELECTASAYINICRKFNGGLQKISNIIKEASKRGNEGAVCEVVVSILVELINGRYNKLAYESKRKKVDVDIEPVCEEDITYEYSLTEIIEASKVCFEVIADSQKAIVPENIKLKPVDVELEMIEQEKKEN